MSSLAEQLSELLDPTVKSIDPEDDIHDETKAKLVEKDGLVDEFFEEDGSKLAKVGSRRMESLEGMGEVYQGRIISRKEMVSDEEEYSDRGNIEGYGSGEAALDEEESDNLSDEEKGNEMSDFEKDMVEEDGMDEEVDSDEAEGDVKIFKPISHADPRSKGKATRNQLSLWESMLEARIKCQKILSISNKLPQYNTMEEFKSQADKSLSATDGILATLLFKLLDLEAKLLAQNSQTSDIAKSDCCTRKRKSSTPLEDIDQDINDRFTEMKRHRNKVLKLWYDKTRLTSTSANSKSKSFTSFERSTVSQIEDILLDRERLLKRTQLKRTEYRVLGTEPKPLEVESQSSSESHSSHLKEFDEEIFDDDDFYHHLLRQLIEQKASAPGGTSDPVELTRQWLRIQRLRSKVKKNVDMKASKGRKIRYEIHQKLQGFMAPNDTSTFSHEARNRLFISLFGNTGTQGDYKLI